MCNMILIDNHMVIKINKTIVLMLQFPLIFVILGIYVYCISFCKYNYQVGREHIKFVDSTYKSIPRTKIRFTEYYFLKITIQRIKLMEVKAY